MGQSRRYPFIALAEGLQDAGHDVTLAITCVDSARYDRFISKSGVKIKLVSSPVISDPAQLRKIGEAIFREHNPIAQTQMMRIDFIPQASARESRAPMPRTR